MAGQSERFLKAGYTHPKWMLPIHGRPLLDYVIYSFKNYFKSEKFVFIYRGDSSIYDFICARVKLFGIEEFQIINIKNSTRGQAETVFNGLKNYRLPSDEGILIFNADTIRGYIEKPNFTSHCNGWLECFYGQGDHWSFVLGDAPPNEKIAIKVVEKKRISNICSTGLYWFDSWTTFLNSFKFELLHPQAHEIFVAPLLQNIINKNGIVRFDVIQNEKIFFSGTPLEYQAASSDARLLNFFE